MIKYIIVKQKHLYTNQSIVLYQGLANFSNEADCMTFAYTEFDRSTRVIVHAHSGELRIERNGEMQTVLLCRKKERTRGFILSEFGTIEVGIYTHKYIKKENAVAVVYDILNGDEVSDGYRIIWTIKEDAM